MRKINYQTVVDAVIKLCKNANFSLGDQEVRALKKARDQESNPLAKSVLSDICENMEVAKNKKLPLCQDTGICVFFVEVGVEIYLDFLLNDAINEGVAISYKDNFLRNSIVDHPFDRKNTRNNTPAVVHLKQVLGDKLTIKFAPKGAGSENMSIAKVLTPTSSIADVKDFIINVVKEAGGKACPPLVVGVGLGGTIEKAAIMAKESLLRPLDNFSTDPIINKIEKDLIIDINNTNIGAMGFGGKTTCFGVKINYFPCHIASLPIAVNLQCHSMRHDEVVI